MEKQIYKMARDICHLNISCDECAMLAKQIDLSKERYCKAMQYAKRAYEKEWRKQSEVDKARLDAYERGKRDVANEIRKALYKEIIEARNSNFEAIRERETKHNVNRYEDTFCYYCDGKIHALDGIFYFVDEFLKKYEGE